MDVSAGSQGGAKSRDLEGCLDESVRAMTGLKATSFVSNVVELVAASLDRNAGSRFAPHPLAF
jgi:hypothetical protein